MKRHKAKRPYTWPSLLLIALFAMGNATTAQAATASDFMERNTDRTGGDFRVFASEPQGPRHCAAECASDAQCKAWTYVAMGNEGPDATCHLKLIVPPAVKSPCCISGVTIGSSTPGRRTGY
ncbi:MAG: PAN domain-containing protein [Parvibaculum sp.]